MDGAQAGVPRAIQVSSWPASPVSAPSGRRASKNIIKTRLRSSTMQPQDRHNPVTHDARRYPGDYGSRRLNKARATADPRPVAERQSFSFEAEQATWDAYRGGRARGQPSRHAAYGWNMDDGFTY